jgi:uncharacterized protein (TIGR03437 family)
MLTSGINRSNLTPMILALLTSSAAMAASTGAPQVGGGSCGGSTVSGTYFYLLAGTVSNSGQGVPYAEFGELVANGSGNITTGQSRQNLDGQTNTYALSGSYTVSSNCTGAFELAINTQQQTSIKLNFQIINNAQSMLVAVPNANEVVTGTAYRTTAAPGGSATCGNGSLSGTYGYVLTGAESSAGRSFLYSNSGQLFADGNGNLTATALVNLGGTFSSVSGTGTYSLASNCQGTAAITTQAGTSNYIVAVVQDGQQVLFLETDTGTTVSGTAQPEFTAPQQAVVNGASFQPLKVAPGSLFTIFGGGLSETTAVAQKVPLPSALYQTQVLLNGNPIPLLYASGGQINAQMPTETPTGEPVTLTVTNGAGLSNSVTMNVLPAAPGLFTNGTQAVVQNPNGSLNSPSSPARAGEVLVAYLTGGGAVDSNAWITGAVSPAEPASVKASYALTVANQPAQVEYLGLTPGFVGLYQANFTLPALSPGSYPIVVTVAGNTSNAALINVGS